VNKANELIPTEFFNMLPISILIANVGENELNPPLVFLNQKFIEDFGWTLLDIPDKQTWSKKAYPNTDYQRVVNSQWDLEKALSIETNRGFVNMEVNIMTKHDLLRRFAIYTQIDCLLIPNHYVLAFERIAVTKYDVDL
jgi:hypothetical protein